MVRITIDDELKKQLEATGGLVELCDASGRPIRLVAPRPHTGSGTPWIDDEGELSQEEFDQRLQSPGPWFTTEELKQKLRELG